VPLKQLRGRLEVSLRQLTPPRKVSARLLQDKGREGRMIVSIIGAWPVPRTQPKADMGAT
jgi:hypothetical protein